MRNFRIWAVVLTLTSLAGASAQLPPFWAQRKHFHSGALAFFEFAPVSGAGMGSACAGTTPTGAKGETLTFTRASTRYCTKGNETSGITNGDLVLLTTGQPAVMPGGDGTGALGLGAWEARTNVVLRSSEFDNAVWTKAISGAGVTAVVTPDAATAPDGTVTADRVQFSACPTAGDLSAVYQIGIGSTGSFAGSVYCRGTSISQTISACVFDGAGVNRVCSPVTCPSTSWTRISKAASITTNGGPVFGCNNLSGTYTGASSTGAADVLLWGAQFELGGTVSPQIPTAGTSATRVVEVAKFDLGASAPAANLFSAAATLQSTVPAASYPNNAAFIAASKIGYTDSSLAGWALYGPATLMKVFTGNDAASSFVTGTTIAVATTAGVRFWGSANGVAHGAYNGTGLTDSGAQSGVFSPARFMVVGSLATSSLVDGVIKQVCVDPDPTRCR